MELDPIILTFFAIAGVYLAFSLVRRSDGGLSGMQKSLTVCLFALLWTYGLYLYSRPPNDEQSIARFQDLYFRGKDTWQNTYWCNIHTVQHPNDMWMHQEIISEVKPDFIIEAGTYKGGSAAIWAMVLAQVNPEGRVITIDIQDHGIDFAKAPILKEKVDFLLGSSTDPKIISEIEKRVKGKKVLVILDSIHNKDHVLAELNAYGPMVSVGSYILVQDTCHSVHPLFKSEDPGPLGAIQEFRKDHPEFVPQPKWERLMFTTMPQGFLQRTK